MASNPSLILPDVEAEGVSSADPRSRENLLAVLDDTPLAELLLADVVAARLDRMLRHTELGELGLRSFVSKREEVENWILRTPNCGRRSVLELRAYVCAHTYRALTNAGLSVEDARTAAEALLCSQAPTEQPNGEPPEGVALQDLIGWHLDRMKPRSREILTRRFGFKGAPKQTLAEIGADLSVTRERIRQIEAQELRRIRQICTRHPLDEHLEHERERCINELFGDRTHVTYGEVDTFARRLAGHISLAVEVSGREPTAWLMSGCHQGVRGCLRPGADADLLRETAGELTARLGDSPLPRTLFSLAEDIDPELAVAAASVELGWHLSAGYVFRRRPGRRATRTVWLHALLVAVGRPIAITELLASYHEAAPTDLCSDRDLLIVMEQAAHMFLEIEEARWTALGPGGEIPRPTSEDLDANAPTDDEEIDDGTVATALERALRARGPTRISILIDDALDILPSGRSPRSVGPTLLMNPSRFIRALPGVWALLSQILSEEDLAKAEAVDFLLNPTQARTYALARHAGEAWGCYPLWTPTAEMRLCRWARRHGDADLISSLLAVASIESWPTDIEDKAVWLKAKEHGARFELCFDPRPTIVYLSPERALAVALALVDQGTIGWITVNRVLRYQACAHIAAGVLDTLSRMGITIPQSGRHAWQLPHRPGPRLHEWIERLSGVIHRKGLVDWQDADLAEFSEQLLVGSLVGNSPVVAEDEMDELEALMAEHRRQVRTRFLQERLEEDDD